MMSIQALHLTRRHMAVLGVRSSPGAAAQVTWIVRQNMHQVAREIASRLGNLLAELRALGFGAVDSQYDAVAFGNFFVDFERSGQRLRLIQDRSQFIIGLFGDSIRCGPGG